MLPLLKVFGTNYEVGLQIGKEFRDRIDADIKEEALLGSVLLPFYESTQGRQVVDKFLLTSTEVYPQYVDEIKGMAEGAGIPFIHLFLLHIQTEINGVLNNTNFNKQEGCTDLYLVSDTEAVLVHSEDTPPEVVGKGYMIEAVFTTDGAEVENFTAYCYPGILPGTAFTMNRFGMCSSLNILFQKSIALNGIPRRFVSRALLTAKSVEEGEQIAKRSPGITTGFNFNYACIGENGDTHISSLEIAGSADGTLCHRSDVKGFDFHLNNYVRLDKMVSVIDDPSSPPRENVIRKCVSTRSPSDRDGLFSIMSNTEDKQFPVYRNGKQPDYLATAAIAVFDLKRRKLDVYTDKPNQAMPSHSWTIPSRRIQTC